jgi:hypothetical protein
MMSGPFALDPQPTPPGLVPRYREMLVAHTNDPLRGACLVCQIATCADWRYAYTQLVCAGEMVAEQHAPWQQQP